MELAAVHPHFAGRADEVPPAKRHVGGQLQQHAAGIAEDERAVGPVALRLDLHRPGGVGAQGPLHHVQAMRAPVGQQAARVFAESTASRDSRRSGNG